MKKSVKPPVVLVFQRSILQRDQAEFDGIFDYARRAGWVVQTVEYESAVTSRFHAGNPCVKCDVKALIGFWKPSGCIVECGGASTEFETSDFGRVPTVFLDRHPSTIGKGAVCVSSDAASIAECAAKELLPLGFSNYAYLPWPQDAVWSRERGEAFARLLRMNGKSLHLFGKKIGMSDPLARRKELSVWVSDLPKPCGVFAANDYLAEEVVSACAWNGVSVPGEIAVLGVDEDRQICENAPVSLSSIRTDNEYAGRLAAELLGKRMADPCATIQSRVFGATGVTRRASTRRFRSFDPRVVKALEFIRRWACEGIEPPAVVAEMGCSRSLADLRFREATGHTILDEIHEVRLARAKELLLKPRLDTAVIPDFCGYASLADLRRVFKKRLGLTFRQFRDRPHGVG